MTPTRAAILVTGSEILLGRIQDRNSSFLARVLDEHGVRLERILAVDDGEEAIVAGLASLLATGVDLVITSGGLGPTHDDRTVAAVARVADAPLRLDERTLGVIDAIVADFARARGLDPDQFAAGNRKQALVPTGAKVLDPVGTAPGVVVAAGAAQVVVLPGPPVELSRMWKAAATSAAIAPLLAQGALPRRVLRVYGVPESTIADAFAALGGDEAGTETTICASRSEIEIVVRYPETAVAAATALVNGLRDRFGRAVFAEGPARLEEIVLAALRARSWTLATAESCTAGLVASRLADVPGASDVLAGGVVAYADEVKVGALGVPAATIAAHGAVSAETARAMSHGARERLGTDVAVAVTGIAGPGGGTATKPVGLVHLHAVTPVGERALERRFPGPRENVRDWSATAALHLVRLLLADAHEP
jgi:nicotinamide-nucleotide amidase